MISIVEYLKKPSFPTQIHVDGEITQRRVVRELYLNHFKSKKDYEFEFHAEIEKSDLLLNILESSNMFGSRLVYLDLTSLKRLDNKEVNTVLKSLETSGDIFILESSSGIVLPSVKHVRGGDLKTSKQLTDWINVRASSLGMFLSPEVVSELVMRTQDLSTIENTILSMSLISEVSIVDVQTVKSLVEQENKLYIENMVLMGNSLSLMKGIALGDPIPTSVRLFNIFKRIFWWLELNSGGKPEEEILSLLSIPPYQLRYWRGVASVYAPRHVRERSEMCLELLKLARSGDYLEWQREVKDVVRGLV